MHHYKVGNVIKIMDTDDIMIIKSITDWDGELAYFVWNPYMTDGIALPYECIPISDEEAMLWKLENAL